MRNKGLYFTGLSSKGYEVEIILLPGVLRLEYISDEEHHIIDWDMNQVHENELIADKTLSLKYGKFPYQTLEITDSELIEKLYSQYAVFKKSKQKYGMVTQHGIRGLILGTAIVIAAIFLVYYYAIPAIGESAAVLLPKSVEVSFGEKIFNSIIEEEEIDSSKTVEINNFVKEINFNTDYPVHVTVVKSPVQNAFALPGGQIVVYDEILENMDSYEQLAALLSHEVAHVKLQHTTKSLFRNLAGYMVISLLLNDVNGITAVIVDNANTLKSLSYSRNLEEEADDEGFNILIENGIDPNGMVKLFEQLNKAHDIDVPEFLSTHPVTENRIDYTKSKIQSRKFHAVKSPDLEAIWKKLK